MSASARYSSRNAFVLSPELGPSSHSIVELLPRRSRRPEVLGDDGDAATDGLDLDDAWHRFGLGAVEALDFAAAHRWVGDDGGEHSRGA